MTPCVIINYYIGCDLCKELHCTGSVELLSYSQLELAKVDTHFDIVYKEYATHWHHIMFILHGKSKAPVTKAIDFTTYASLEIDHQNH